MPTEETDADGAEGTVDGHFRALLEGLRTTIPSAQVLLGFLLILPFQPTFVDFDRSSTALYLLAFFTAALASVLLIAPSVHQRVRAPQTGIARNDSDHVAAAVRVSLAGTIFLGLSILSSTVLVSTAVDFGWLPTLGVAAVVAAMAYAWLYQPFVTFRTISGTPPDDA